MSLINDALKRAREAQRPTPGPAAPQFRPVEPAHRGRRSFGLLLPFALAGAALCVLFLVWQYAQRNASPVAAKAAPQPEPTAAAQPAPQPVPAPVPAVRPVPAVAPPSAPPAAPAVPLAVASYTATAVTVVEPAPAEAAVPQPASANASAVVEAAPPKPAPLKLQAIIFNPQRPSAMIGGKTLFIGDRLGQFQVTAIDQESATLVGGGQTNVLSLP